MESILTTRPSLNPRSGRILIVDDEPLLQRALQRLLSPPHEVLVAGSGPEALELLREEGRLDLILCDLLLPGMTGLDLHAELRRTRPEVARRTVLLTGAVLTPWAQQIERAGLICVAKPFDPKGLVELVAAWLAGDGEPALL